MADADMRRLLDIARADVQQLGLDLVHEQIDDMRRAGGSERAEPVGEAAAGETEFRAERERAHDIETAYEVTEAVLRSLFGALYEQNVLLEGTILKASMVVAGKDCAEQPDVQEVAESTLMCLKSTVPAILPGVVFLSGGQDDEHATAHLDAMNRLGPNPWTLSFSYGRAMQQAALALWAKDMAGNVRKAQDLVLARARANGLAALGQWQGG